MWLEPDKTLVSKKAVHRIVGFERIARETLAWFEGGAY